MTSKGVLRRGVAQVRIGILLFLCLLCPFLLSASVLRFAWLSDTHIGSSTAEDDLRASVRDINSIEELSFVLLSGDVTEYGTREQLKLARKILDDLKIPSFVIPGNHDTKWSESGATDFSRIWPEDRFVFEREGFAFVGLHQGPLMRMGDGHWAPQDIRWLEQTLSGIGKEKPVIFVTHYPIDDGIANWFVALDLLKRYNVQAVLCGHGHASRTYVFEGVPGVMGRSNLRAKAAEGGYNLVAIVGDTIKFAERRPSGKTLPAWHSARLQKHDWKSDTNTYPRPDYGINTNYPAVSVRWTFDTHYTIASGPAVGAGKVFAGDASGTLRALSVSSGKPQWTFKAANAVYSTPAIAGKRLVVPSTDGSVYCLDVDSGRKLWEHKTDRPIVASPAIANGTVYIGSSEGKFRALSLRTGRTVWEFDGLKNFVETRPLLYEGKVIFGAWDQYLYALDAAAGALVWKWKGDKPGALLSPAACWPVAAKGKVFVVAPDRQMTCIEAATGRQVWRSGDYTVRESIGISPDGSRVYTRSMNDFFHAFSAMADKPEKVWECNAKFGYDINSAMLVEKEGVVFFGTKNGLLFALNATDGAILWRHKFGPGLMNTVAPISKDQVAVTDFDGRIALIENTR